ncbi:SHOCT domain-containing protein [Nakamurella lactea]|uniref:SHOCT domain-containing protein n=1 Tax=Nakamurella lactea TaxID=459515 RepID=UPI00048B7CED|nr:SHOCT domain-containing protein [Nakamurella lactea]
MIGRPMMRAGRPGLLGTVARTAVIAGTATAVSGGMTRHAQQRAQEQQQAEAYQQEQLAAQQAPPVYAQPAPPPPAAGAASEDLIAQLRELGELRSSGVLTEEEFAAQKAKLLNG